MDACHSHIRGVLVVGAGLMAGDMGRPVASPAEVRKILGLKGIDQVVY
jgi:hypothetical protein